MLENKQNRPENLKIVQKPGQKEVSTCYIIIMRESKIESFEQIHFLNDPFWPEPPEISKMESFTTIVNGWKGFHYCFKALLLGVCKSPNCCFHYGWNFVSLHIRTTLHQLSKTQFILLSKTAIILIFEGGCICYGQHCTTLDIRRRLFIHAENFISVYWIPFPFLSALLLFHNLVIYNQLIQTFQFFQAMKQ